jgi:mono/diheme cytochrome c family protein
MLCGVSAAAIGLTLCVGSVVLADSGPPTPNPLSATLNPAIKQLPPRLQALLQIGALPVPNVDITGLGAASSIHGDAAKGATEFAANCAVCHGDRGAAGIANPGSDDGTVPVLNPIDPGFLAHANGDAAVFARDLDVFIQHGSRPSGDNPLLSMPAWGDHHLLTQADIADIEAYVMSLNGVFWPDRCPGIQLGLANPASGSRVDPGSLVVEGSAVDVRASAGSGISRVDFFLDDRDAGGKFVGTTVPGQTPGSSPSSFRATLSLPKVTGGHELFAYAFSAVRGQEGVLSIPIAVGEDPSKAFVTAPPTGPSTSCTP